MIIKKFAHVLSIGKKFIQIKKMTIKVLKCQGKDVESKSATPEIEMIC